MKWNKWEVILGCSKDVVVVLYWVNAKNIAFNGFSITTPINTWCVRKEMKSWNDLLPISRNFSFFPFLLEIKKLIAMETNSKKEISWLYEGFLRSKCQNKWILIRSTGKNCKVSWSDDKKLLLKINAIS